MTGINNDKAKWYEDRGIDRDRYMQLKFVARRYEILKKREEEVRRLPPSAQSAYSKAKVIQALEESAYIAAPGYWRHILKSITQEMSWEQLTDVPCGRAQFYAARRRFFVELDKRVE